jgi:hypothetical protein
MIPAPPPHGLCRGSLILHRVDRLPAGCTEIEDGYECAGLELRHEGDPTDCVTEWGSCGYCGIVA